MRKKRGKVVSNVSPPSSKERANVLKMRVTLIIKCRNYGAEVGTASSDITDLGSNPAIYLVGKFENC